VSGARCACDCCDATQTPGAAWTPDGYCARCSQYCFPAMECNGQWSRAHLDDAGRRAVHATSVPQPQVAHDPRDPQAITRDLLRLAIQQMDPAARKQLETTVAVAQRVGPVVLPKIHQAAQWVWQRVKPVR